MCNIFEINIKLTTLVFKMVQILAILNIIISPIPPLIRQTRGTAAQPNMTYVYHILIMEILGFISG